MSPCVFFLRFGLFPGVILAVPGTPPIDKIRVRLREAPGVHFETNLIYFWGSFEGASGSFSEGLCGAASSVKVSIGPFAPSTRQPTMLWTKLRGMRTNTCQQLSENNRNQIFLEMMLKQLGELAESALKCTGQH